VAFSNSNLKPSEKTENSLAALKTKNPPVAEEISARGWQTAGGSRKKEGSREESSSSAYDKSYAPRLP
jgi:hypothetical protein